jgi:hypothetical protein
MKYLLTGILGFLVGAAAAMAALYFNPLTDGAGPLPAEGDSTYSYASPVTSELVFTHGGLSRLPSSPSEVPYLWEATINKTALSVLVLKGADGSASGVASRVSYPDEDTELLATGALLNDDWTVSFPGQGSLFVTARSNWWPLLKEAVIPVWYLGQLWPGPEVYTPTVGPGPDGRAVVRGASGRFAGQTGSAAERYQIEEFDDRLGPRRVHAELYWRFDERPPETAAD